MKKKLLSLAFVMILILALVACEKEPAGTMTVEEFEKCITEEVELTVDNFEEYVEVLETLKYDEFGEPLCDTNGEQMKDYYMVLKDGYVAYPNDVVVRIVESETSEQMTYTCHVGGSDIGTVFEDWETVKVSGSIVKFSVSDDDWGSMFHAAANGNEVPVIFVKDGEENTIFIFQESEYEMSNMN